MSRDLTNNSPGANIRVLSVSPEPFRDRVQAGQLLASQLTDFEGKNAVVLGIPRGGILVARELASRLKADLDIVLARKLGTPGQLELAMGSISEDGSVFLNQRVVQELGLSSQDVQQEKTRQMAEIKRRSQLIRSVLAKTPLAGRIVIVTDDGLATGSTMQAALWAVRQEKPRRLIAAVPVASDEALERISPDADEVICLRAPPDFYAVGQFYYQFYQVQDEEVLQILAEEPERRQTRS